MKISKKKDTKSEQKNENYGLNCLYTNADQLLNKLDDLLILITSNEPGIMMVTEVIPKEQQNSVPYSQLSIKGYDTTSRGESWNIWYTRSCYICQM